MHGSAAIGEKNPGDISGYAMMIPQKMKKRRDTL
jgi:hypothetical protein